MGIQDATQKRRDSSQFPGAWSGSIVQIKNDGVYLLISQEKWNKTKSMITEMDDMVRTSPAAMDRKRLEQIRGFLIYVTRTYPSTVPYLM